MAHGWVVVGRESVGSNLKFCRTAPLGLAATSLVNLHASAGIGFAQRFGKIHGVAIGGESGYSLVKLGVQVSLNGLGTAPLALVIFFHKEHIGVLSASNLALHSTHRLLS